MPTKAATLAVGCEVCQAKPGEPCTTPTATSRRDVTYFHYRREQDAA